MNILTPEMRRFSILEGDELAQWGDPSPKDDATMTDEEWKMLTGHEAKVMREREKRFADEWDAEWEAEESK
jgi:hypothetical protein